MHDKQNPKEAESVDDADTKQMRHMAELLEIAGAAEVNAAVKLHVAAMKVIQTRGRVSIDDTQAPDSSLAKAPSTKQQNAESNKVWAPTVALPWQ